MFREMMRGIARAKRAPRYLPRRTVDLETDPDSSSFRVPSSCSPVIASYAKRRARRLSTTWKIVTKSMAEKSAR
jgi:hypothetical protein